MSMVASTTITTMAAGDIDLTSGFETLYRAEYPGLVAVARALTGDFGDAEDIVQDTMVKTFVGFDRVRRLDRPGAWCHQVLLNACRSRWRRRKIERRYLARRRPARGYVEGPSTEVALFWALARELPSRPRAAIVLHFAGERTLAEIAEILDVPQGTVHSDIARARQVMIRELSR